MVGIIGMAGLSASTSALTPTPSNTPTVTPTKTPTVVPPTITDAAATRDALLATAQANLDAQATTGFLGFYPQWRQQYPGLQSGGSAVSATGNGVVSTMFNYLNSKDVSSPTNPVISVIAVADTSGRCEGAVLYGFPKTDKVMKISSPTPCTAQGVVTKFKAALEAPTTASPSVIAPAPPATGTGVTGSEPANWAWVMVAGALLVASSVVVLRHRQS